MSKFKKYLFTLLIIMCMFMFEINYVNASSKAGKISLTKVAVKEDVTYGRSATVTLGVSANAFTTVDKTDVVLVLDRSTSMNENSMTSTKNAAKDLVDLLITDKSSNKVRVGIVTYGTNLLSSYTSKNLTNNKAALINLIDSIPVNLNNQGTNIHAGLIGANKLLASSESGTQKIVILLSDGEPTFYMGTNNNICGNGQFDSIDWASDCNVFGNRKPSTVANREATTMKSSGITIYTIGFNMSTSSREYAFLGNIATSTSNRYTANDYETLRKTFKNIVNDFTTVATAAKVVDIVPVGFQIKEGTLSSYAKAVVNSDGTTTITWDVGDIKSTEENLLSYIVEAKEGHYGSMYTNVSAVLTATTPDKNPYYEETNLKIYFEKPVVPIPGITNDDNYYDIKQGTTFNALETNGILKNDKLNIEHLDKNATVVNRIVLVTDETTTGNINDINMNSLTGAFTYKTSSSSLGQITYKYYVETTVTLNGKSTIVKSNTSTITLNVIENPTTYVVNYLEKGTNEILHEKKNGKGNVYDVIEETAIEINGYDKVEPTSEVVTLDLSNNIINFYYIKRSDLSYTVNYLEKGTNNVLHEQKVKGNKTFGNVITSKDEIISIDGYNYNSVDKEKLIIATGENIINIYYTKRTDLSYTVNYLEKGTNKVLYEQKTYNSQIFGNIVTSKDEIISIDGYNYDSVDKDELTITTGDNIINIYYTGIIGTVKAIYVDTNGKEISDSIITEGRVTTEYKTKSKEIYKYRLLEVIGNESGLYEENEIVVTYVYEMIPITGISADDISIIIPILSLVSFITLVILRKKIFN